jgi:antitoxin HicB
MQNPIKRKQSVRPFKKFNKNKGMSNMNPSMQVLKYQMLIQWSDEDQCFLVAFPDFPGSKWRTHGDTYQEAVENGIEALESLTIAYAATNEPLPLSQR